MRGMRVNTGSWHTILIHLSESYSKIFRCRIMYYIVKITIVMRKQRCVLLRTRARAALAAWARDGRCQSSKFVSLQISHCLRPFRVQAGAGGSAHWAPVPASPRRCRCSRRCMPPPQHGSQRGLTVAVATSTAPVHGAARATENAHGWPKNASIY